MLTEKDFKKNELWMFNAATVTKFNPIYRNENGVYQKDEWDDYGDIGRTFDGKKLSFREYKIIEDKYVESIKYLFTFYNCNKIQLISKRLFLDDLSCLRDDKLGDFYNQIKERRTINISEVEMISRLILRGALNVELWGKDNRNVVVRFDSSYYMFFNCPNIEDIKNYIEDEIGLYVDL